jgi:Protein of unknown function (DUF3341)
MILRRPKADIYGIAAEFDNPNELLKATKAVYEEGYREMDAYSPFPIEEVFEALPHKFNWVPYIVLAGGLIGVFSGYMLEYYAAAVSYPLNIGGRPLVSWPAFIPPAYETTILFASLAAVVGMLALNGFPRPYHPIFNAPNFDLASQEKFFLCVESTDPKFDKEKTLSFMESLGARQVSEVAW